MKQVLSFLLCLLLASAAHGQALRIDSTRFYCNGNPETFSEITDIIQTKDKGFFFTGRAAKPGGGILPTCPGTGANPCMGKLDSLGNIEWIKSFCDTSHWATTACQTADGGYAINGTHNPQGMSICRYDAQGNFLWRRDYGKNANSGTNKIIATPDKGFLMLGIASDRDSDILVTYDYPPKAFYTVDWVLIKLDSLGTKQWVRTLGTSGEEYTSAVLICDSSNYYFIGDTESKDHDCADVAGHPGDAIYIIKLDSGGNVLWSKARGVGDVSQVMFDERDNSIVVTGKVNGGGGHEMASIPGYGYNDIFLMKIDTAGAYKWGNIFGTSGVERDGATLCKAPNGGYFVAGNRDYNTAIVGLLISADSNGQLLEQHEVSAPVSGFSAKGIFPFRNSYCLLGVAYAPPYLNEGAGQNCMVSSIHGSRALTFSTLSVVPLSTTETKFPEKAFTLSPNPTRNSVTVHFEATHPKGILTATNVEGKQITQQRVSKDEETLTLATTSWPPGVYLICFQPQGQPAQCHKLIVQ